MSKPKARDVFCVELVDQALIYVIARSAKGAVSVAAQSGFAPDRSKKARLVDTLFAERAINRKPAKTEAA